jgi:glucose/arabinose dehydrogenase
MRLRLLAVALGFALVGAVVLVLTSDGDGDTGSTTQTPRPDRPASSSEAQASQQGVKLARVGNFDNPVYVTAPPGDKRRIFVVEQTGRIRVLVGGKLVGLPFLDLSNEVTAGGEQGLLSVAFSPSYARNGLFYVHFSDRNGNARVQEFKRSRRDPNRADKSTRRQLLFISDPFPNHNGGLNLFGPDGYLYIGLGDGGAAADPGNRAQNLETLFGKILRIDPRRSGSERYRSPRSNPFVGRAGRNEIYAYGLRNPWRFSFDRKTGDLYIGDVGQNRFEEVDYERRGAARGKNFGWSCFEGNSRFDSSRSCPRPTGPVLTYPLSGGRCAVTGGVVVRDPALPSLNGRYVYADFCGGDIRSFRISGGRATDDRSLELNVSQLSSFGEDAGGRVYVTSLSGTVYRLVPR